MIAFMSVYLYCTQEYNILMPISFIYVVRTIEDKIRGSIGQIKITELSWVVSTGLLFTYTYCIVLKKCLYMFSKWAPE